MELADIIPSGSVQRAYCEQCTGSMDLVFRHFQEEVSGIWIDIDGLPLLWCPSCDVTALPEKTREALVHAHSEALKHKSSKFVCTRRKIQENFGFTGVPFDYDPDDYYYYPGLFREFNVGFLTPVFFNRRVLAKYDASPEYVVQFASPTYGHIASEEFSIPFGVNRNGLLLMWLGDIVKLSQPEQYYLKSENVPSDHSISSEFYDGQIECVFTAASEERKVFAARSIFLEAAFDKFGVKLAHLDTEVIDLASALLRPVYDTQKTRRDIADTLNKIHLESLDNSALGKLVTDLCLKSKGSGSLKRIQVILESVDASGSVNDLMMPFYVLYDLRVAYSHLDSASGASEKLKTVTERLGVPEGADLMLIYDEMLKALAQSYMALKAILQSK